MAMDTRKSRMSMSGLPVFQYTGLYARISEAKNLQNKDLTGVRDVFCYLKIDNEAVSRTASVFNSHEPFWGEEYRVHVPLEFHHVSVYVYDHDHLGIKVPMGKVSIDRQTITASKRGLDCWLPLKPINKDDMVQGDLLVEVMIDEFTEDMYRGVITVVEARDIAAKDMSGKTDPYATIQYGGKEFSTQVLRKTRFPRWNKTYELPIKKPLDNPANRTVKIVVNDWDKFHSSDFLGEVVIDLAELQLGQRYKTWYRLKQHEKSDSKKEKDLGSLRIKVQCQEEKILDSQFYGPFVQLMLKSVEHPSPEGSPLLIMLEDVMTADRNVLAHTLVRFYIAHGAVLPMLDCLVSREVNETKNPSLLFRGNSLASKCFDQFMKVVALPYLHETLKPLIDLIFSEHKLVELDPDQLRSARSGSTSKTIEGSVSQLTCYVQLVTDSIFGSVVHCPTVLRQALKLLWQRVSAKFPDEDIPFIAVTGFIFLRFFVPAILSPKLFAIRDEHADQKTERTLKLIAKVLQNIGNLKTVVDAKEQFMQPMASFLVSGVEKVKKYITMLIDVEDNTMSPALSPDQTSSGYLQHVNLCSGVLWKRVTSTNSGMGSLLYRRRYFELSNIALTYFPTEKKTGEAKSYPVQWIKVVEKLDEAAFRRKHMFQVVVVPSGPSMYVPSTPSVITLYLQAADVNEQNRWVSAIRKACLSNRDMSPVYHPGSYQTRKKEWTCCRASASAEPGCCPCHRGITIGDWRDPLDPYLDAQVIYSQYDQGRSTVVEKYLGGKEEDDEDDHTPTPSPTEEEPNEVDWAAQRNKSVGRELMTVLNELAYHHSQVLTIT